MGNFTVRDVKKRAREKDERLFLKVKTAQQRTIWILEM